MRIFEEEGNTKIMNVLITGKNGFIGHNVTERLRGQDVRIAA